MRLKTHILNFLGISCILGALFIGTLPFAFSFLCGLLVVSRNLSHSISFCFAAAVTMFSAAHPGAFDFGVILLRLHDAIRIHDDVSFVPILIWNMVMASVGANAGSAMRMGYREAGSPQ